MGLCRRVLRKVLHSRKAAEEPSHTGTQRLCRTLGFKPSFSDHADSSPNSRPHPQYGSAAGTFRRKFRKNSGKTPETLSERFLESPSRVRLGCPKPYNSRHLRLPEHFQNPQYGWGRLFFSELVPERASQRWSWNFWQY